MEIERELKKVTLGHEFGAGAACLKCKDKCEGFELHFWRKICRNCKCGLTEHDVAMNSEENKKVGKLFEDTKYTGLIAKLKTDGIPSYQGNMVTITLPSPATAYTVPPSATSTVVPPSARAGSVSSSATAGPVSPSATAGPVSLSATAGSVSPSATAGSVPSAGASAGSTGIGVQGQARVQSVPASATPVRASKVPVTVSATSANVVPVPKDVPMKTVTYEWAPPVANKYLAVRYIELLPPEKRPVVGTEGAAYRRQQMARQLPEHDQDPSRCHELSPAEVKLMQQYVRKYKDEALGVGDVMLPEEMALVQAGGLGGSGVGAGGAPSAGGAEFGPRGGAAAGSIGGGAGYKPEAGVAGVGFGSGPGAAGPGVGAGAGGGPGVGPSAGFGPAGGAMGTTATAGAMSVPGAQQAGLPQQNFSCHQCQQPMRKGEPAVYAERAGYDKMWHPACFVCCTCNELLVDMIYFWKKGKMYCGRHYGDSEKPRCGGCDELIFSNEYTQAEGQNWHLKHFCCFECDCILAGETYVMENDKPVCKPCYMKNYAVKCSSCQNAVEPEAQRVSYGDYHWHAEPQCFKCSGCSKCLIGQRFMAVKNFLFCSVECKKKIMA
ncbi:testin isoform X1 [Neolamprologus brichardi]|uniref:testin isoform X1 n=1 Tax=Neolamprologus brichardi TaxID=32507 RepID=UPI001643AE68|nr:testin isoform X1 [Neolamprologus brichardi]